MRFTRTDWLVLLLLAGATIALYAQSVRFGYTYYDDPGYTFRNEQVGNGLTRQGVRYAFTSNLMSHWHPLTWLSYMLDVELFGISPRTFHRTNVALHTGNVLLVYLVLRGLSGSRWRSALATALFALHPLRVESVVWIAERKDVLSMFMGLLAMLAYLGYVKRCSIPLYVLTCLLFAMCLLAKPMLVTLPAVLVLVDYWPLRRFASRTSARWAILDKLPLVALSLASCWITLRTATGTGAVHDVGKVPLWPRVANAIVSYVNYLLDMVWPTKLAILYPFPESIPTSNVIICGTILLLITAMAVIWMRRFPHLAVGWFWYLGVLFPVNGLISIGELARADRYTYFPMIGILIMLVWSIPSPNERRTSWSLAGAATAVLVVLSLLTWRQIQAWRDTPTLFRHTLAVIGPHPTILMNYGAALTEAGHFEGAAQQYLQARELKPNWIPLLTNLGNTLVAADRPQEAIQYFDEAIHVDPDVAATHFHKGVAYMRMGQWSAAEWSFRHAVRLDPQSDAARQKLNIALARQRRPPEY